MKYRVRWVKHSLQTRHGLVWKWLRNIKLVYRSDSSRGRRQLFFQEGRMDDGEDANSARFKHQIENISGSGGWLQRTIGALRAKVKHVGRQNFRSRRELIILLHVRGKPWSAMKKEKRKPVRRPSTPTLPARPKADRRQGRDHQKSGKST